MVNNNHKTISDIQDNKQINENNMAEKFVNIMREEFFLHNANGVRMPETTSGANLELSFALVEDTTGKIFGWVMLTPSNVGALQVALSSEDDKKQLEKLQSLQGCLMLDVWAENDRIKAKLINAIPGRINAWNDKYNQKIAYYFMDVVADNSVKTTEIELNATGSFEYLESAYTKKTIVYYLLNS